MAKPVQQEWLEGVRKLLEWRDFVHWSEMTGRYHAITVSFGTYQRIHSALSDEASEQKREEKASQEGEKTGH